MAVPVHVRSATLVSCGMPIRSKIRDAGNDQGARWRRLAG
jgi:hypothetical protein